jgi:hypothetical protein
MQSSKKIKIGQLDTSKLISANYTASSNDNLIVNATCTITDVVSPVNGSNYEVTVVSGNVTIGGVVYTAGNCVKRVFNDGAWGTYANEYHLDIPIEQTISSTTGDSLNFLDFNLEANSKYKIEGFLRIGNNTTAGHRIGVQFPSGATCLATIVSRLATSTAYVVVNLSTSGSLSSAVNTVASSFLLQPFYAMVTTGETSGTFRIIVAAPNGSTTVIAYPESSIMVKKLK